MHFVLGLLLNSNIKFQDNNFKETRSLTQFYYVDFKKVVNFNRVSESV